MPSSDAAEYEGGINYADRQAWEVREDCRSFSCLVLVPQTVKKCIVGFLSMLNGVSAKAR